MVMRESSQRHNSYEEELIPSAPPTLFNHWLRCNLTILHTHTHIHTHTHTHLHNRNKLLLREINSRYIIDNAICEAAHYLNTC